MDIGSYDAKTASLIQKTLDQQKEMEPGIFRTITRLKKTARETQDDALMGFALYQQADACYAMEVDYAKFRKCLGESIVYLRQAEDPELLMRAYNLVGIDATNNGSLDVAYYYFMMALRTGSNLNNNYLNGIVNANIGQVYSKLGNPREARKYVRLSNRQQRRGDRNDIYFYHNLINGYFMEAMLDIELGETALVKELNKKIEQLEAESGGKGIASAQIPVSFMRTQMAMLRGDKQLFRQRIDETIEMMKDAHQLFDFMEEITQFCFFLLDNKEAWSVRRILDLITDRIKGSGIVQMQRLVSLIELAYYEKIGDEEQINRALRKQHELTMEQEKERNRIYLYSIDLISTMDEMRKEQARMRSENKNLQKQAQTDALTGIPNRLMLNRMMEEAFERAYARKTPLCIEILDIDSFKEYNDTYGHQAGDKCLKKIANEIAKVSEKAGVRCARYGGDEFVLIYEDRTDKEILQIARKLEQRVKALNIPHKKAHVGGRVAISQGLCNSVPGKKNKVYDFLTEADNALYAVKKKQSKKTEQEAVRLCHLPESFG